MPYYDRDLLRKASEVSGIHEQLFGAADERIGLRQMLSAAEKVYTGEILPPDSDDYISTRNLFSFQAKIIKELAETENDLDEIVRQLEDYIPKIETSFLLDRLDYLAKGGRCSMVTALGANLLNLKPCIELRDGKMSVGKKYRGHYDKCLASYIKERLLGREDIDRSKLILVHTEVDPAYMVAVQEALSQCGKFDVVYEAVAGCTISCHCGPNTVSVIFARK